jgi:hypothetical protein
MKKIIILVFLCVLIKKLPAQNIVPNVQTPCTTTGQGTAGNFVINYTIGEMPLIKTEQSNGLMITQGILQPIPFIADTLYECYSQTEVTVFPNPTPGVFSLRLSLFKKGEVNTRLFDGMGKLLQQDAFAYSSFITKQYNISKLASGQYYLQLFFKEAGSDKPKKCVYTIQKIN